ncbi:MAG: ribosome recycling factor [Deltaproteobacteria bacterium]
MGTKEILQDVDGKMKKSIEATRRGFSEIRTGRASPHLVEGLHIDYYGTPTILKSLASITVPDARLIVIQPWDASAIPEIEKAIAQSNLGITPMNDGKIVRLQLPHLTQERREELKKVVKDIAEEGRVSLRTIRRDANDAVKKLESDKKIPEDEKFKAQDQIQKVTDRHIKDIDDLLKEKEKELSEF